MAGRQRIDGTGSDGAADADATGRRDRAGNGREGEAGDDATGHDGPEEADASVLVVSDFPNPGKIERHIMPLGRTAETTMVCVNGNDAASDLTYRTVPDVGSRPANLLLMGLSGLYYGFRGDFDGVVSFSLLPHGLTGFAVSRLAGVPAHLGIIGADVDVHARAWYGPAIRFLLRRFDSISVPGEAHREYLEGIGVPAERITVLRNAIDVERYRPDEEVDVEYDFLWAGRFGPEKDPRLYVEALAELADRGVEFRAVMLGDGDLRGEVERLVGARGLGDRVDLPGWVDEPVEYYHRADSFVLTSRRDAMPLALIEAMATGLAPVVPPVGNIPTLVDHGENALVVPEMEAGSLADALERLATEEGTARRIGENAARIRSEFSYEAAREDWEEALRRMGVRRGSGEEQEASGSGRSVGDQM